MGNLASTDIELARLAASLVWFTEPDEVNGHEGSALGGLAALASKDIELARMVAHLAWFTDDVIYDEMEALRALAALASKDIELARMVAGFAWFTDDVTDDEWRGIDALGRIASEDIALARTVSELPWFAADVTYHETNALYYLERVAKIDLDLAVRATGSPWVEDGIFRHESSALYGLWQMADWNPEFARHALGFSADAPVRARDLHLLTDLYLLRKLRPELFEHLTGQPWFTDGLDPEERAFIIALDVPTLKGATIWWRPLVETRFTRSATISLPLAGEVDLWAIQHAPFPVNLRPAFYHNEDLLVMMEKAVRGAERFMALPFPMNDVIVLLLEKLPDVAGEASALYEEDHIRIKRSGDYPVASATVYHELAHHYFPSRIGPPWLREGGAEFIASYIMDWLGVESLEDRLTLAESSRQRCVEEGIENIHWLSTHDLSLWGRCHYSLGRHFLISLFQTLGEEAMSSALRELYLRSEHVSPYSAIRPTEEEVYRTILKHTPTGLEEEFRDLYRRLHGGPFIDAED